MTARDVIRRTNADHAFTVQCEHCNRGTARCRATDQKASIGRPDEVVTPPVFAWVKEWNLVLGRTIDGIKAICFTPIAMETGHRQILQRPCTTTCDWDDMIERETDILPLLCGMTVFAQPLGSLPNALLERRRDFLTRGQGWPILRCRLLGNLGKITDYTIEKAEVVIHLLVAI